MPRTATDARPRASRQRGAVRLISGRSRSRAPRRHGGPAHLTVAGQTAPGDGVCIRFDPNGTATTAFQIQASEVVVRYLRVRAGFSRGSMDYGSPFWIAYTESDDSIRNVILDHVSSGWHPGRTGVSIWPYEGETVQDVTIQRYLASEALLGGDYPNGARGAFLFGTSMSSPGASDPDGYLDRITLYKSLMAHNRQRNPEAKTCQGDGSHYVATFQFINNVMYGFDSFGSLLVGNENDDSSYHIPDEIVTHYNVFGNYYAGSEVGGQRSELTITPGVRAYVGDATYGNLGPSRADSSQDPWSIVSFINWNEPGAPTVARNAPSDPYRARR